MPTPNDLTRFTMKPTRWIVFLRTFVPYQLYRFVRVNLRMMVMIWRSHAPRPRADPPSSRAPTDVAR